MELSVHSYLLKELSFDDYEGVKDLDNRFMDYSWTRDIWDSTLGSQTLKIFIFKEQMKLFGFALFDIPIGQNNAHLCKIVLTPEFQGISAGPYLWEEIEKYLSDDGMTSIFLEVESQNLRAIGFYDKIGFKELHRTKGFYSDGADAVKMQKVLCKS